MAEKTDSKQPISSEPSKTEDKKPFRPPDFYAKLRGQRVKLTLVSGQPISGDLVGFNPYDLLLEVPGRGEVIVPKHGILYCEKVAPLTRGR